MGKRNTFNFKKYILPINILIIIGLFCAYRYYDEKVNDFDEFAVIEGVGNTNCYGSIEGGDNPNWEGSRYWNIGGREILYTKVYLTENYLVEDLQITNSEYMPYLLDNEPFGEDENDE